MKDPKQTDQEVFESIPWEELRDLGDTSRRRRIWFLVGGAAVVSVLVFSVVRTFSAPDPGTAPVPTTGAGAAPVAAAPPLEAVIPALPPLDSLAEASELLSEADLMAGVDPAAGEEALQKWQAASYSEWFVLEFFTLDGSDLPQAWQGWLSDDSPHRPSAALSYVEWVRALRAESLADGRWRTEVALRRLVSTDGVGYIRLPTQAVEVVVDMGTGTPAVVDLPRFIALPEAELSQWWLGEPWETPPAAVIRTAREQLALSAAGTTDGEPRISRTGETWRVEWAVVDQAGISWPVSLWLGPEGTPVPAGG